MSARTSPKRHTLEVIGRPEGGSGGTGPAVVPPDGPSQVQRDIAAAIHDLVDRLLEFAAVDRALQPPPTNDLPLLLNAVEAGELLSLSRSKVLDLAAGGRIPSIRIGAAVRIPRDLLLKWITDNCTQASRVSGLRQRLLDGTRTDLL